MNLCEKVAFIALKDTKGPEIWLEANTSQRAKHPRQSDKSVFEKKLGGETNMDCTDITDFIRGAT